MNDFTANIVNLFNYWQIRKSFSQNDCTLPIGVYFSNPDEFNYLHERYKTSFRHAADIFLDENRNTPIEDAMDRVSKWQRAGFEIKKFSASLGLNCTK